MLNKDKTNKIPRWEKWFVFVTELSLLLPYFGLSALNLPTPDHARRRTQRCPCMVIVGSILNEDAWTPSLSYLGLLFIYSMVLKQLNEFWMNSVWILNDWQKSEKCQQPCVQQSLECKPHNKIRALLPLKLCQASTVHISCDIVLPETFFLFQPLYDEVNVTVSRDSAHIFFSRAKLANQG